MDALLLTVPESALQLCHTEKSSSIGTKSM